MKFTGNKVRGIGEYFGVIFLLIMASFSQELKPPQNPGRFTKAFKPTTGRTNVVVNEVTLIDEMQTSADKVFTNIRKHESSDLPNANSPHLVKGWATWSFPLMG